MPEEPNQTRTNDVFNLGFRRGANDRAAAGLPYGPNPDWPSVVPDPPAECNGDAWCSGYRMGYVIGAADCELLSPI